MSPAGHCKHSMDGGGMQPGQRLCSGWGSCFLCVDVQWMLQLPTETSCTVLGQDFPWHAHTDTDTVHSSSSMLSANHCPFSGQTGPPAVRTEQWPALVQPGAIPLVLSSPLRSQQTPTTPGYNLLVLLQPVEQAGGCCHPRRRGALVSSRDQNHRKVLQPHN